MRCFGILNENLALAAYKYSQVIIAQGRKRKDMVGQGLP
jgi:hypothetical protein